MTRAGRRFTSIPVVLVHGVVLGVALAASVAAPGVAPAYSNSIGAGQACPAVEHAFRPTALAIDGVVGRTRILARGQDQQGIPRPPPLTERGKWQFAWDKEAGVRPGDAAGVVRLTAHTYPRDGSAGAALGNRLLARLRTGAVLEVSGAGGTRMCYRVNRRQRVPADGVLSGFYDTTGRPRVAILICSGKRRGPGDWSHRSIWYAVPVLTAPAKSQ